MNLDLLFRRGEIDALDLRFANAVADWSAGTVDAACLMAAALLSRQVGAGHVCLDLANLAGQPLFDGDWTAPPLADWLASLTACSAVGSGDDFTPLIVDATRLYLQRHFRDECRIADDLRRRCTGTPMIYDKARLATLFAGIGSGDQRRAAALALSHRLAVISGGPGTGKTTTLARILALLVEQAGTQRLDIALAAPTGKAAARMQEAVRAAKLSLSTGENPVDGDILARIPDEARTLHRLLGIIPGGPPRHNAQRPLAADVVVVDEASMIDLALMARLLDAVPAEARLILLGDRDQLASVEAGAVFADLCGDGRDNGLGDAVVELTHSFRFAGDSGIGRLASEVRSGDGDGVIARLSAGRHDDLGWQQGSVAEAQAAAAQDYRHYLTTVAAWAEGAPVEPLFAAFNRFRLLCANRQGPAGTLAANEAIERHLRPGLRGPRRQPWYAGRPIMITANDYGQRLFNGDIGLTLPDADADVEGGWRVWFESPQGARSLPPSRLPAHETVFAMTVHKAQGSEFDNVMLLLPPSAAPLLTRELLYTGITRARRQVSLWAGEAVLRAACSKRAERTSGLRERLAMP
jgi:exodeoxyribonuclease V alpha subunit